MEKKPRTFLFWSNAKYPKILSVGVALSAALVLVVATSSTNAGARSRTAQAQHYQPLLGDDELQQMLQTVKGGDDRLFRWNAMPQTVTARNNGGCAKLAESTALIKDPLASPASKATAAEFLTFCITDSPQQRARFSQQDGIHKAVVTLVQADDSQASAMASHLIYIATFSNQKNHQTFVDEGAVQALASVILNEHASKSQQMWAAAAMQNLAASYCDTKDDGRCYWGWTTKDPHVVLRRTSLPMISDGTRVRKQMLAIKGLVEKLIAMACTGPVHGKPQETNVFPGPNAILGRDDNDEHLVVWAGIAGLKNLALEPLAKSRIEPALVCLCEIKYSPDWWEEAKSYDLIRFHDLISFLRRSFPCWEGNPESSELCIDENFLDDEEDDCSEYDDATTEECQAKDVMTGMVAQKACCWCGGGTKYEAQGQHL